MRIAELEYLIELEVNMIAKGIGRAYFGE